jgi:hypothetical protein
LHHKGLYDLYSWSNIIRAIKNKENKLDGTCGLRGEEKGKQNFTGKFEGKAPLGKPSHTRENNIKKRSLRKKVGCGLDLSGSE